MPLSKKWQKYHKGLGIALILTSCFTLASIPLGLLSGINALLDGFMAAFLLAIGIYHLWFSLDNSHYNQAMSRVTSSEK
jgi:hypothetical protein